MSSAPVLAATRPSTGAINVLAGTNANTDYQQSSSRQIGDLGSNGTGTGFSVGVANSHSGQDTNSQTQSTIRSQIVSKNGDVTLDANQDVTVQGSDVSAGKDLTLIGKDLNLDPGNDATQSSMSQSASQFGVTLALGGVAGNAVATVNQAMTTQSSEANNPRLAALDKAEAALSAYGDAQAASSGEAPALIKATVSIGGGTSHSESQSTSTTTDGSTLTAGGGATLIATGSGATDATGNATDGDINSVGTQITAQNVTLSAARDINLLSAQNTTQNSSSNSSTSASIGVGASLGGTQNGFTIDLAASGAKGNANGQSVTNENTQITAANTVSITSGRDTNLIGAEVSGNTVDANVGRNLTITSPQDTNTYNSQQSSAGFQASICVPPICYGQTVSGSASASDQTIKDNFQSVGQQSGIYAGTGGFDVNVGNHTQLNGGVVASTATADKNSLSTQTFGYTNLQNTADYSGSTIGGELSASSQSGSIPNSLTGGPQFSQTGNSASGTTYAAVSPGTITVRGDAGTGQDSTAGLSRNTASANGSVQNTFNAQNVANNMAIQQEFGQLATVAVGQIADELKANDPLFAEGGAGRDALHAAVAAIGAAISGGNVAGAVGGSVAGDELQLLAAPIIEQAISQLPADAKDAARNALDDIVATAGGALGGALAGSGSQGSIAGAGSAANNEVYNKQDDLNDPEAQLTGESKSSNPFSRPWWVLVLEGFSNGLSALMPGEAGGPPAGPDMAPAGSGAGQAVNVATGTPGYVPSNATFNSGSQDNTGTPSPALPDSPYSPESVDARVNPPYQTNPAHDTGSSLYNPAKTPEPADAESAYESGAVRGGMGTWYAQGDGGYYRYFSDNAGTVHFSGTVPASQVPNSVLKILGK
jgi:filamentous hemagglutinin